MKIGHDSISHRLPSMQLPIQCWRKDWSASAILWNRRDSRNTTLIPIKILLTALCTRHRAIFEVRSSIYILHHRKVNKTCSPDFHHIGSYVNNRLLWHLDSTQLITQDNLTAKKTPTAKKIKGKKSAKLKSLGTDESVSMLHAIGRIFNPKCMIFSHFFIFTVFLCAKIDNFKENINNFSFPPYFAFFSFPRPRNGRWKRQQAITSLTRRNRQPTVFTAIEQY